MIAKTQLRKEVTSWERAPSPRQTAFWFVGCKLTPPLQCDPAWVTWRIESVSALSTSIGPLAVDFCLGVEIHVLVCEVCSLPKNEGRGKSGLWRAGKWVVVVPLVGKTLWPSRFLCLNLIFPTRADVSERFEMWGEAQGKIAAGTVKKNTF